MGVSSVAKPKVSGSTRPWPFLLPLRRDKSAQSAAVGTILAIMVIMTLLTVVTTRWIPVWVQGKEADHAAVVDAQFAELKKTVDQQALIATPGQSVANPITLGQPGVPVFAPGSSGSLNNGAYGSGLYRNQLTVQNESQGINQTAYGAIKYSTINTRYVQQSYLYEFGAIIINQTDGQLLKTGPAFTFENSSNATQLRLTLLSIAGDGSSYSSASTVSIRTSLLFAPVVTDVNYSTPQVFWLNITSECASSWAAYLNKTISSRLPAGQFQVNWTAGTNVVTVRFATVNRIILSYQVFNSELDLS
jgi:hypothetical protein